MPDRAIQRLLSSRSADLRGRLAKELVAARAASGLSQRDVAAEAGIDRRWIARAEAGNANLTLDVLVRARDRPGHPGVGFGYFEATGPRLRDHLSGQVARRRPDATSRLVDDQARGPGLPAVARA